MEEPSKEYVDRINREMSDCVLDYIRSALEHFGVPRGTFADDQFDNFVSMYNQRGNMLSSVTKENHALRDRIQDMEGVLVAVANWPNPENHPQIRAIKVWSSSVVDPAMVDSLKTFFEEK